MEPAAPSFTTKLENVDLGVLSGYTSSYDMATIGGLAAALIILGIAIAMGGSFSVFADMHSILLVLGSTIAITTASYSLDDMRQAGKVLRKTMVYSVREPSDAAMMIMNLAELSRKHGLKLLERVVNENRSDPFLSRALLLVSDGTQVPDIERILRKEMAATMQRHYKSASILRRAAEIAPAMGLIGTLVGLVQMLGYLDNPAKIGPAMALALLATLYGALLANLVFNPLASKLERNSNEEELLSQIYIIGATSIARQENPRRLEMMLNTVLPPAKRISFFE